MRRVGPGLAAIARKGAAALLVLGFCALPGAADEAAREVAVTHLEAGTLAEGDAALGAIVAADGSNDDARFGLGVIRFVAAIESLSQGLYRYGLVPPESMLLPIVRMPVPINRNPEPITYEAFRGLLMNFVADLADAESTLAGVSSDDTKLPLDLAEIRYDVDGDGTVGDAERLAAVMDVVFGLDVDQLGRPATAPNSRKGKGDGVAEPPALPVPPVGTPTTLAFDRADALWLRGYTHVLMGFGEFLLAHDWHLTFDTTFHLFFPRADLPFAAALDQRRGGMFGEAAPIADFISFLHLIRWEPTEPERLLVARDHLKSVIALSRETWEAVGRETDDDREWLPGPNQTSPFAGFPVDAERIDAWYAVLDEADALLDGETLVPHWRFRQGFNLRRVFEEPTPFDLVLWITGPAALPYLEDGPETSGEDWLRILDVFQGGFANYAAWFN